ncbi:MAG: beta-N-acetylhexosaminidase [Planctomycetota bacterium]
MNSKVVSDQAGMLDVQIGQMLMVGFRGLDVNDNSAIIQDIKNRHIGGVILFDRDVPGRTDIRNIKYPAQLKNLTAKLQSAAEHHLLIAIDQEGGRVCRLKPVRGFPQTKSAQYLGQANDLSLTNREALKISKTLSEAGINLNLAPVVDLNINPDNPVIGNLERSFSADAEIVTNHAAEFIKAHRKVGILCALKHFPGHGSSTQDSHKGLTDVTKTWTEKELVPYQELIDQGLADIIMTAHVYNAELDHQYPATLSKAIITGVLRDRLNYDGVVISDDMQMGAITDHYGFETAIELAVKAGVDIILIANNSEYDEKTAAHAIEVIKKMVRTGRISQNRIYRSYLRIQKLKRSILQKKPL